MSPSHGLHTRNPAPTRAESADELNMARIQVDLVVIFRQMAEDIVTAAIVFTMAVWLVAGTALWIISRPLWKRQEHSEISVMALKLQNCKIKTLKGRSPVAARQSSQLHYIDSTRSEI